MKQKLDSFVGYVGRCVGCGRLGWVREPMNVLYTDGKRSGYAAVPRWQSGKVIPGQPGKSEPNEELLCPWRDCQIEHGGKLGGGVVLRPLETLEEQEVFQAAYRLGGENAVYDLIHARGWR